MSRWSEQGILLLVCCLLWYFSNNFKASHKWVLLEQLQNPQRSNLKELLPSHDGSWEVMYQTDQKQNINSNWHNSIDAIFQCANKVWVYCCMKIMIWDGGYVLLEKRRESITWQLSCSLAGSLLPPPQQPLNLWSVPQSSHYCHPNFCQNITNLIDCLSRRPLSCRCHPRIVSVTTA